MILKKHIKGFTFAEVLLVTVIIGVIATITMSIIYENILEQETVARLTKAYSTLQNAHNLAISEHGLVTEWNLGEYSQVEAEKKIFDIYSRYIVNLKVCGTAKGCWDGNIYRTLKGTKKDLNSDKNHLNAILNDGTYYYLWVPSTKDQVCNLSRGKTDALKHICAAINVDLNGAKDPNQRGKDVFTFYITPDKIVPMGTPDETAKTFPKYCDKKNDADGDGDNGGACTAWVLANRNLDYLKCSNLSWSGKRKC